MSRIAFTGNSLGTGTVTIASPNTNSDRTVTLPDQTGTLVLSGNSASFSSATISGATTTGSLAVNGDNISATNSLGFRNRILNGGMVIDQRNAGASVTNGFAVDRFEFQENSGSAYTIQRSTTAPAGFTNSVIVTVTTAASATAAQVNRIFQRVEGNNIADLGWGTANAQTVTLSFRVRSSLTGTYCVALVNGDATRSYVAEYTISAANTWETKTVTIAGDTSGTWATDNTSGVQVTFDLGGGSNYNTTAGAWAAGNYTRTTNQANFANTNGATFYITGVQLEAGSVASPFERRDYGRELMMCQRYYQKYSNILVSGYNASSGSIYTMALFPVEMRATPSLVYASTAYTNASNLATNVINTKLVRFALQITSTGLGFATADIETSGAEL